ncbi:MAG: UDP-glucose 4-epimerase [Chlamydiae bacterium RIFCSPLOWO2_01_FULL_28_7]|nr:MAG: UDP-glucose 4-epimerase [Chlamydiae bacterium RIFCSPLOWO2_01_FULL_28_7]
MEKIFVLGGAGYVGSMLVPKLLTEGYKVKVFDLFLFGEDVFKEHIHNPNLEFIKGDLRNLKFLEKALTGCDIVIHLACISNDPSFELNPQLGKSINLDSFEPFVRLCVKHKIKRFIYASSSSVYGVKDEKNVSEDVLLEPLTDYSKFKAECEKILLKYKNDRFVCTILRPATVCGYSPRQRLDVIVNILTSHAVFNGKIKILGGAQLRPNIHISDMVEAYMTVLKAENHLVNGEIFNAGYNNYTVEEISKIVQKTVSKKRNVLIEYTPTNDNRSYHISSEKIKKVLNFKPKFTINDAVEDLLDAFEKNKLNDPMNNSLYYNILTMKKLNLV